MRMGLFELKIIVAYEEMSLKEMEAVWQLQRNALYFVDGFG